MRRLRCAPIWVRTLFLMVGFGLLSALGTQTANSTRHLHRAIFIPSFIYGAILGLLLGGWTAWWEHRQRDE